MGPAIEVGILADLSENDPEAVEVFKEYFRTLNVFLASAGLPPHSEPRDCPIHSGDMYGYSGLHYLRRIAAHLDGRGSLPPPGDQDAADDGVLEDYLLAAGQEPTYFERTFGKWLRRRRRSFDHLIVHSDAEGFYLPLDFPDVLFPPDGYNIPGCMIGSSVRLRDECERLAAALQLPLDLDPDSDEVFEATESQGEGPTLWQRYGIESFNCLRLHAAATHSIKTGAAIVFC